jgi:DNA-binding NtrC family response regulator
MQVEQESPALTQADDSSCPRHSPERAGQAAPIIVGKGMEPTRQAIERAAATNATVLLVGETGTGKEVCARYLHQHSARARGPFVAVSCAALPETLIESELFGHEKGAFTGATVRRDGYFAAADGGTLFLDDIDDLPLGVQSRLLQILQANVFTRVGSTRPERVDLRMIAATKKDLGALVEGKLFRDDLMYRLSVITIRIPPLRARREDIAVLAELFLTWSSARVGGEPKRLTEEAVKVLEAYDWPGNVRQLKHAMESVVVMHPGLEIEPRDLPGLYAGSPDDSLFTLHVEGRERIPLERALEAFERALLEWAMKETGGNQALAAKLLHIPRSTFQYRWARSMGFRTATITPPRTPTIRLLPRQQA